MNSDKKKINIWESFNFDDMTNTESHKIYKKLEKIGDQLERKSGCVLKVEIVDHRYISSNIDLQPMKFKIICPKLGNYSSDLFEVVYDTKNKNTILSHNYGDGKEIIVEKIKHIEDTIEKEFASDPVIIREIERLYTMSLKQD